jgi:hypothetical protein
MKAWATRMQFGEMLLTFQTYTASMQRSCRSAATVATSNFYPRLITTPMVIGAIQQLTRPKIEQGIDLRGFSFFDATEQALLQAIQRAEFNIHGLRREISSVCFKRKALSLSQATARFRSHQTCR